MKPCLVDVNVWVGWTVPRHSHHAAAAAWFDQASAGEAGWNRFVQLGVMRVLGNPVVMGSAAVSAPEAWRIVSDLGQDLRVDLIDEPRGLESAFGPLLRYSGPTNKLIADAYLAAVAIASSRRLVTFDRGFRQFDGLDLLLL
jgi:toxin-antitoxin system PIN domain toxin